MSSQARTSIPFLTRLNTMALYIAAFGLIVMTAIVAWQVFCRYVLNDSPNWTDITAILIMSWFIFLGAAVGVRENNHMGFDVLLYVLPPSGKKWLRMISEIVVFGFGLAMVWFGFKQIEQNWSSTMTALGLPEGVKYIPLTVGGVLIVLFSLERIMLRISGAPIDEALDEMAPTEIAVELESIDDVRKDAAAFTRQEASHLIKSQEKKD